jgi:membrane protease YdiL (CAAX protease family)
MVDAVVQPKRRLSPHLRGHILFFDGKRPPEYGAATGFRLLIIAATLEVLRLVAVKWLNLPLWLLAFLLLGSALLAIRFIAGLKLSSIGLRRWREWTTAEKSYFVQVLVVANVVFPVVLAAALRRRFEQAPVIWTLCNVFVPYLFFGFYQEVVYRGMLQLELIRRWGVLAGILSANLLYTFGPLHSYYFSSRASLAVPMFASIFIIGLFFGLLFRRSGNLWLVAIFHALGNAYIVGSLGPIR